MLKGIWIQLNVNKNTEIKNCNSEVEEQLKNLSVVTETENICRGNMNFMIHRSVDLESDVSSSMSWEVSLRYEGTTERFNKEIWRCAAF